jgi:hypothetical protein
VELEYDEPLSNVAFRSNLRRYMTGPDNFTPPKFLSAIDSRQGLPLVHFSTQPKTFWPVIHYVPSL